MGTKPTASTSAPSNKRLRFADDPTCIGYQFIRLWTDKDNTPITSGNGNQVKSASAIMTGGGWDEGYSLSQLNADIESGKVVAFVNGKVIVYRKSTRESNGYARASIAA